MKRKSLAGKCGIPFECDRVYVAPSPKYGSSLDAVTLPNGRRVRFRSTSRKFEYGREFFGNVCRHYVMLLAEPASGEFDVWEEGGKWFIKKSDAGSQLAGIEGWPSDVPR